MKGKFLTVLFFFLAGAGLLKGIGERVLADDPVWWAWCVAAGLAAVIAVLLEPRRIVEKVRIGVPAILMGGFGTLTSAGVYYTLGYGDYDPAPSTVLIYAIITGLLGMVTFLLTRSRPPAATA